MDPLVSEQNNQNAEPLAIGKRFLNLSLFHQPK